MTTEATIVTLPEKQVEFKKVHPEARAALDSLFELVSSQRPNTTINEVIAQAVSFVKYIDDQQTMGKILMGDMVHGYNDETRRVDVEVYKDSISKKLDSDSLVPIRYTTEETVESEIAALAGRHGSPDNPVSLEQEFEQILLRANFYSEHFYAQGQRLFMRDTGTYNDHKVPYPFKLKKVK